MELKFVQNWTDKEELTTFKSIVQGLSTVLRFHHSSKMSLKVPTFKVSKFH
jgi:hypothetical protein